MTGPRYRLLLLEELARTQVSLPDLFPYHLTAVLWDPIGNGGSQVSQFNKREGLLTEEQTVPTLSATLLNGFYILSH